MSDWRKKFTEEEGIDIDKILDYDYPMYIYDYIQWLEKQLNEKEETIQELRMEAYSTNPLDY